MKLLRLDLRAFGPFTDVVLDLEAGHHGLHVIYGPNEAGKTSALRAVHQLFYGISERPADAFRHSYDKLRIGARLQHSDGSILDILRRKARLNSLRDARDQEVVEAAELARFLGGLDHGLFTTMFGIDREALARGGQEILQGGGQLGQVLFAAGSGISDLRRVQENLKKEMDELFKRAGKTQKIPRALQELRQAQEAVKNLQLSSEDWLRHDACLREARRQKEHVEAALKEQQRRARHLTRIRTALPLIARRRELLAGLESCRDMVLLSENFSDRRMGLQESLRLVEFQAEQAEKALAHIALQLPGMEISETLLADDERIEELHLRLGEYQKALKDRPRLVLQGKELEHEAREILRSLGQPQELEKAERFRLRADEPVAIQNLGNRREGLLANLENARQHRTRLLAEQEKAGRERQGLEPPRDVKELRQALRQAQQQGFLEKDRAGLQQQLQQGEQQAALDLARLPLWSGTLADLACLPVPAPETIDQFEGDLAAALDRCRDLAEQMQRLERSFLECERQLRQLDLQQEVPSEEDLQEARNRRDAGWQLIRRAWQEGEMDHAQVQAWLRNFLVADTHSRTDLQSVLPGEGEGRIENPFYQLAGTYEQSVSRADSLADRLRREADRVARKAELQAQANHFQEEKSRLEILQEEAQTEQARLQKSWSEVWKPLGIVPRTPREMQAWARQQADLLVQARTCRALGDQIKRLQEKIAHHANILRLLLEGLGMVIPGSRSLEDLLELGQQFLEGVDTLEQKHRECERDLARRQQEIEEIDRQLAAAEEEWSRWQKQWARAMARLGLEAETGPEAANVVLAAITNLFQKLNDADRFRRRLEGLDRDIGAFTDDVLALAQKLVPGTQAADPYLLVTRLYEDLKQNRSALEKRQNLFSHQVEENHKLEQARSKMGETGVLLQALCREAGCESVSALPAAEERSRQRRQLEKEIQQVEEQLLPLRGGAPLDDFLAEVAAVDPDSLETELNALEQRGHEFADQLSQVDQAIGREQNELSRMDGSADAAEAADQAEQVVARLQAEVQQYATLRLAAGVLQKAIERYREKNQGPVLARAGRLFAGLTAGAFAGLQMDFGDKGEPVLIGLRAPDRQPVFVEGLSEGTRDQLFLALRLAALETFLTSHEPVPFVVDDLLVTFDDDRALAALKALAELSTFTQVIFFTHHQHLLSLAEENLEPDVLFIHRLDSKQAVLRC